jgi:hypothetical protein
MDDDEDYLDSLRRERRLPLRHLDRFLESARVTQGAMSCYTVEVSTKLRHVLEPGLAAFDIPLTARCSVNVARHFMMRLPSTLIGRLANK